MTKALLDASNSVEESPVVYVPRGVYSVQNVVLPSNVSLYLAPGSVLRLKASPKELRSDWTNDAEGRAGTNWITTAPNSTNIRIFGRGTIDGRGYKYSGQKFAPSLVVPILTKNFVLDGPILRDSGSAALNVIRSEEVTITNVKVLNRIRDMVDVSVPRRSESLPDLTIHNIQNGAVNLAESQKFVQLSSSSSVADQFLFIASLSGMPSLFRLLTPSQQPRLNLLALVQSLGQKPLGTRRTSRSPTVWPGPPITGSRLVPVPSQTRATSSSSQVRYMTLLWAWVFTGRSVHDSKRKRRVRSTHSVHYSGVPEASRMSRLTRSL